MSADKHELEEHDHKILEFLFRAQEDDFKCRQINAVAQIVSFLLVSWGWGRAGFLSLWGPMLIPEALFLGCVGLFALLLVQLVLGTLYRKQVFFLLQVKVFRFALLPPMLVYCLNQTSTNWMIAMYLAIAAVLLVAAFLVNYIAFKESFVDTSMRSFTIPRTLILLPVEVVILLLQNTVTISNEQIKAYLLMTALFIACALLREHLMQAIDVNIELRISKTVLFCHLFMVLSILVFKLGDGELEAVTHGIITALGLVAVVVSQFLHSYERPWILFHSVQLIHEFFTEHMEMAEVAIVEADEKLSEKDYFSSALVGYMYHHCRRCNDPDCPIKLEAGKVELTEFANASHLARMPSRFVKKLDTIFEQQHKERPEELDVKVSHLRLILLHSRHKSKGLELLADIEDLSTSFRYRFLTYGLRKKVQALDSGFLETGEQTKLEEDITLFRYDLYFTLTLMMDFWSQFFEERVDLNKLISVSTKLFPFRQEIEQLWRRIRQVDSFATAHTMLLYAEYVRQILNDDEEAERIQEEADRMKSRLRDDKTIRIKEQQELGVMIISLNDVNLGEIKEVNTYGANLFGYGRKQALRKRINDFMPKVFAQHHDGFLQKFLSNRNKSVNTDERPLLGRHRNHCIFPIKLQLRRQLSNYSDDILFMASIKQVKFRRPQLYCVVDEEGTITDQTAGWKFTFRSERDACIESVIKNFWSLICGDEKHSETFLLSMGLQDWGFPAWSANFYLTSLGFLAENAGYILRADLVKNCVDYLGSAPEKEEKQSYVPQQLLRFQRMKNGFEGSFSDIEFSDEFKKTMPLTIQIDEEIEPTEKQFEKFGVGIKVYRLQENDLYRVEDDQQNWSEFDFDDPQNNASQKRQLLQNAKEGSLRKSSDCTIKCMRYATHFFALVILCVVFLQYVADTQSLKSDADRHSANEHTAKTQTLAAYLVSRIAAERAGLAVPQEALSVDEIRRQLQNQLFQDHYLDPRKKERLMKLVYLSSSDQIQEFLADDTLNMPFIAADSSLNIEQIVETLLLPLAVLMLFLLEHIYQRLQTTMFSIFLELDQRCVKQLYHTCSLFVRRIQKESEHSDEISLAPVPLQDNDQEYGDNHKVKKLKNIGSLNRPFLIKVSLVLLLVLVIMSLDITLSLRLDEEIGHAEDLLQAVVEISPVSSILLMRAMLQFKLKQAIPLPLKNDPYFSAVEDYDLTVVSMLRKVSLPSTAAMSSLLYSNMCVEQIVDVNRCQMAFDGALALGGNSALSLYRQRISLFQQEMATGVFTADSAQKLFQLQFVYVKPLMDRLCVLASSAVETRTADDRLLHHVLLSIMIILAIAGDYLVLRYVIGRMRDELCLTRELVNLIPSVSYKDGGAEGYTSLSQH